MSPQVLDVAVGAATGADLAEIGRRGFSLADPREVDLAPEPDALPPPILAWDDDQFDRPTPVAVRLDPFLPRRAA